MIILCIKVFFGKLIDVTLSTMQTMHIVSNKRVMASIIGFFDVFVWFIVVKEALTTNTNSIWIPVSYALGFAFGTLIGSRISNYIIKTMVKVSVITEKKDLSKKIINHGFGGTIIHSNGLKDNKDNYIIMSNIENRRLKEYKEVVNNYDKNAIVVISESKNIINGYL